MIKKMGNEYIPKRLSELTDILFTVDFVIPVDDDRYDDIEKHIFIGVFQTKEDAQRAVDKLLTFPDFNNCEQDSFIISNCVVDMLFWDGGFVTINY